MTCIVGVETDEGAWIGADSWADDGWHGTLRADPKLFERGPLGSLATTDGMGMAPAERVMRALEAVNRHCSTVRPPFLVRFQPRP